MRSGIVLVVLMALIAPPAPAGDARVRLNFAAYARAALDGALTHMAKDDH